MVVTTYRNGVRSLQITIQNIPSPQRSDSAPPPYVVDSPSSPESECDSSSSDSSVSDESSIENSDNETEQNQNVSFSEMLETPDMTRKATTKNRKPAINSRAQVVTKNIFENSGSKEKSSSKMGNKKIDQKKTCQPQPTKKGKSKESWYCKACKQDRVADMHLCSICECYLHDDCMPLSLLSVCMSKRGKLMVDLAMRSVAEENEIMEPVEKSQKALTKEYNSNIEEGLDSKNVNKPTIGIGRVQLNELYSSINIHEMSEKSYMKHQNEVQNAIDETTVNKILLAGAEEYPLAEEAGNIDVVAVYF
ncbi:hypothetical protein RN001_003669 [Aquatica leii]|uniref:Uncharacterized protein n=1 Tax=Aquatica leii TaxID=1421715 RepID=A0AAN7SRP0_9COLE|nr:hypothetical protein RN001_003669 [Aquatica leii]